MPTIFPTVTSTFIGSAMPGDLVRTHTFQGTALAFIATKEGSETRHLVMLAESAQGTLSPQAAIGPLQDELVLNYGPHYRIDLDTTPRHNLPGLAPGAERPGAIGIRGGELLLRVACQERGWPRTLWYGMATGTFRPAPNDNICYVTAWTLALEVPPGMAPIPLARFTSPSS